jgi:hypothetical protein
MFKSTINDNEDKPIAPKNNGLLKGEIEGASQHVTICLKFCLEAMNSELNLPRSNWIVFISIYIICD